MIEDVLFYHNGCQHVWVVHKKNVHRKQKRNEKRGKRLSKQNVKK